MGLTDQQYIDKVNSGNFEDFINDSIGFGIANLELLDKKKLY